ncbi:MAG: glutaredoxin 3 [Sphingomicrobium sp.]
MAQVEIYTKSTCPYCIRAKRLLESKGIKYEETSVDTGGAERQQMIARANGRTTVPQIFVGGKHIGGCDDLMMLEYERKLDAILAV